MSGLETASLAYLCAGLTCWVVLAIAYLRIGLRSTGLGSALPKVVIAMPVILLWPLLVFALVRREKVDKRSQALRVKQDEPSQGSS